MAAKGLCCSREITAETTSRTGVEIVLALHVHLRAVAQSVRTEQEHHLELVVGQNDVASRVQLHDYVVGRLPISES